MQTNWIEGRERENERGKEGERGRGEKRGSDLLIIR
jgi:hypothetical protein